MSDAVDPELRQQRGKALRKRASRKQHDHIGGHDRDPVALLEASGRTRLPRLLPLRYGRMLASPFAFFRGSAIVQAHDLAGTPYSTRRAGQARTGQRIRSAPGLLRAVTRLRARPDSVSRKRVTARLSVVLILNADGRA